MEPPRESDPETSAAASAGPDTPTVRATPAEIAAGGAGAPLPSHVGRHRVRARLGAGGFGDVLLAHDPVLDREVAVKVLHAGSEADRDRVERFLREARAAARLEHPNVVHVHEVGWDQGRPFIVMELVRGRDLSKAAASGGIGPRRAAELLRDVARAVEAAHALGIVHRDIKPSNILLGADGRPRLTDFGLARDLRAAGNTERGIVVGTPAYLAPEQIEEPGGAADDTVADALTPRVGDSPAGAAAAGGAAAGAGPKDPAPRAGPRADIYALGAVLYELVAGRPPFKGSTTARLLRAVLLEPPARPRTLRPDVPEALEAIALRCLEKEPERRYPSAAALALDLERFLADAPVEAAGPEAAASAGRRRLRASALAVALGAALGGLAILVYASGPPPAPPAAAVAAPAPAGGLEIGLEVVPVLVPAAGFDPARIRTGVAHDGPVREGDGIRFEVALDRPAHVYLFNIDGAGRAYCLFPAAYADFYRVLVERGRLARPPLANPLPAGRVALPTPVPTVGPDAWFRFDATPGVERYLLFAAPEAVPDLEALARATAPDAAPEASLGAASRLVEKAETFRGSYRIEVGTAPAEVRLPETPDRLLSGLAARLRGRGAVVWEHAVRHDP